MNHKVKIFILYLNTLLIALALFSCEKSAKKNQTQSAEKLATLFFYDSLQVKNIEIIVEIVKDDYHRAKGLMFRANLPENQGMLFIFENEDPRFFWMKNTTISLDIIYLDSRFRIVNIHKNTSPLTENLYPSEKPAMYVVEVRAGFSERYQVSIGDSVSWQAL